MLIVGREIGQSVIIDDEIKVTVMQKNSKLQLLIDSPGSVQLAKINSSQKPTGYINNRTQKIGETILIGDNVKLTILQTESGLLRFAIDAPKEISVFREEIYTRKANNQNSRVFNLSERT